MYHNVKDNAKLVDDSFDSYYNCTLSVEDHITLTPPSMFPAEDPTVCVFVSVDPVGLRFTAFRARLQIKG